MEVIHTDQEYEQFKLPCLTLTSCKIKSPRGTNAKKLKLTAKVMREEMQSEIPQQTPFDMPEAEGNAQVTLEEETSCPFQFHP